MLGMSVQLGTLQEFQSGDCQSCISMKEVTRTEDVHLPSLKISFVRLWWSLPRLYGAIYDMEYGVSDDIDDIRIDTI